MRTVSAWATTGDGPECTGEGMRECVEAESADNSFSQLWERTKNGTVVPIGKKDNLLKEEPCPPL